MKKKTVLAMLLTVSFCLALGACSGTALPEGFVEEDVLASAENVITLISSKNYEAAAATFSEEMAKALDAKGLEDALGEQFGKLGEFKEYKSEAVIGKSDKTIGDYAVAVIVCSYENSTATYTISVDTDANICGLYMK